MGQEIGNYINESRAKGMADAAIKQALVTAGWKEADLNPFFTNNNPTAVEAKGFVGNLFQNIPLLSLRLGLGFIFIYAAIFVSGDAKVGAKYVPAFVTAIVPLNIFLPLFSVFEVVLGVWILSAKFRKIAGIVTVLFLLVITVLNYTFFTVTFRNVAIIAAAITFATL